MKFNWGHGITVFFIVFVAFILIMIFKSTQNNIHLVSENYYSDELVYQERMDEIKNVNLLQNKPVVELSNNMVLVSFPQEITEGLKGQIKLFRPSDSGMDRTFTLALNEEGKQVLNLKDATQGYYKLQLQWTDMQQKKYFKEESLFVP